MSSDQNQYSINQFTPIWSETLNVELLYLDTNGQALASWNSESKYLYPLSSGHVNILGGKYLYCLLVNA